MRKTFLTGLIILLPVAITFLIVRFLLDILTEPFIGFFKELLQGNTFKERVYLFLARLAIIVSLVIFTLFLGFLGRKLFFRYLLTKAEFLFERIPLVKGI